MTHRGRLALALGGATYLAAWAFGSKVLYPVALGLPAAVLLAWLLTRLANRPLQLRRTLPPGERLEGEDVEVGLELLGERPLVPAKWVLRERIGRLGEHATPLAAHGRASYVLEALPRGRYAFEDTRAEIEDPFGLERVEQPLSAPGALLVYPRLVELDRLFSESGARSHDGRRLLLQRPAGFDLHSVREHERGESLRKVHWRSTAKRGQLMVKELEDSPRDEVAVVLDADPAAVTGESFDVQVRAAGSILLAHSRRGRRAVLVVNSGRREQQRVHSGEADWRQALDLLAAAEPEEGPPLAALLADDGHVTGRALELAVVTASLPPRLVERLVERSLGSRNVSLVLVDAASFAGAPRERIPELLRLQAAGVAAVVLRQWRRPRGAASCGGGTGGGACLGPCSSARLRRPCSPGAGCGSRSAPAWRRPRSWSRWRSPRRSCQARAAGRWSRRWRPEASSRLPSAGATQVGSSRASADGFLDFYDVQVPFDPGAHPRMHGVLLVALFAFTLWVGLAAAARRPGLAAAGLVVGVGWPGDAASGSRSPAR